jgi:hypothetical protein
MLAAPRRSRPRSGSLRASVGMVRVMSEGEKPRRGRASWYREKKHGGMVRFEPTEEQRGLVRLLVVLTSRPSGS